jgi:hypothetical protein
MGPKAATLKKYPRSDLNLLPSCCSKGSKKEYKFLLTLQKTELLSFLFPSAIFDIEFG